MILIDEPNYRIVWTSPIPFINGVMASREQLLEIWEERHGLRFAG